MGIDKGDIPDLAKVSAYVCCDVLEEKNAFFIVAISCQSLHVCFM